MSKRLPLSYLLHCAILCLALCGSTAAQDKRAAEATPADEQSVQALLKEVRLMRVALERATNANLNSYQAQLTMERVRIQQEHVDRLARQLDAARNELVEVRTGQKQLAGRVEELEEIVKSGTDQEQRKQAEIELKQLGPAIETLRDKEQSRAEQERQLTAQAQVEQTKLDRMNEQLEKLMLRLAPAATSEAPASDDKHP